MSIQTMIEDLRERSREPVLFHHWDPYILGVDGALREEVLSAGEVAEREEARWRGGRFPSLAVAVADAVFSKQRKYRTAVTTMTRPFSLRHGSTDPGELVALGWVRVYADVFHREPRDPAAGRPHHLTPEGRIHSILAALRVFVACGAGTVEAARRWARDPETNPELTRRIHGVPGVKEAMVQNVRMNLGSPIMKQDVHVRRVLAAHLPISETADAAEFARVLREAAQALPWSPFRIDQIIWYTEAARVPAAGACGVR